MAEHRDIEPEDVLAFWFTGDLGAHRAIWFQTDIEFDAQCRRFGAQRDAAARHELDHWAQTPLGALALILLLDQLSRNLHRGSPEAFAADSKARLIAHAAIAQGYDRTVPPVARMFFYLPFEHSENPADQAISLRLFDQLGTDAARHARLHHEVIQRFGRFPGRNAALGRHSSPAEEAYLSDPDRTF